MESIDTDNDEVLAELTRESEEVRAAAGGRGSSMKRLCQVFRKRKEVQERVKVRRRSRGGLGRGRNGRRKLVDHSLLQALKRAIQVMQELDGCRDLLWELTAGGGSGGEEGGHGWRRKEGEERVSCRLWSLSAAKGRAHDGKKLVLGRELADVEVLASDLLELLSPSP
eukprot:374413-Hanusia_phi.AAC.4